MGRGALFASYSGERTGKNIKPPQRRPSWILSPNAVLMMPQNKVCHEG
jgi:hypothetical protein